MNVTLDFSLSEELRWGGGVNENMLLKRIFKPKREKVTIRWKVFTVGSLHIMCN
jgi:hypothetical protein